jgi:micrococcal nuclease
VLWWRSRHWHHHRTSLRPSRRRFTARGVVAPLVVAFLCACCVSCTSSSPTTDDDDVLDDARLTDNVTTARVLDVIDGDTIELRIGKRNETVRLIGIDTPETVHPTKPVECFGAEASTYLASLLPKDTQVRIQRDVEARDYYDRLLLYVYRASDNLFVNQHMVETGHARAYPFEPNTAFARTFAAVSYAAQTAGMGLWGSCPR